MQQPPGDQTSRSLSTRRTRSVSPGAMVPTTPVYVSASERQNWPQLPVYKRRSPFRRAALWLLLYGLLLGFCFWLAFPLLYDTLPNSVPARSLTAAFPWLSR
jgi:hypothetical protein